MPTYCIVMIIIKKFIADDNVPAILIIFVKIIITKCNVNFIFSYGIQGKEKIVIGIIENGFQSININIK